MNRPEEPELEIVLEGKDFTCNRENTTLYTFAGNNALYDHVFLQTGEEDERTATGSYVFSNLDAYGALKAFVINNKLQHVANMNSVADCDVEAFVRHNTRDIAEADYIPDKWEYEV